MELKVYKISKEIRDLVEENNKYNPLDKGHRIYQNYFELINSNDTVFKYGLVWWFIRNCKIHDVVEWLNCSDYEYEFFFLRKLTLDEIKQELENRLNGLTKMDLFNNNIEINITNVDDIAEQLYNKFINICKECKSKLSISDGEIIYGTNRLIRCFDVAGLLVERIPRNSDVYTLITNYANQTFNRHICFDW